MFGNERSANQVDVRLDRDDCGSTILLPPQVQTCHQGATEDVTTPEDTFAGCYYQGPTSQRYQAAV
jgi:hypothetical protein